MRQIDNPEAMPTARGAKTLGWFMDQTDLLGKQQRAAAWGNSQDRRNSSSDESKSTTPSAQQQLQQRQQIAALQQQKKHKRYRKTLSQHGAARKEGFSHAMSESSEEGTTTTTTTTPAPAAAAAAAAPQSGNDEYWFYDVATDGYYYEQNGVKGWRRRQPNQAVHKAGKDTDVAHLNVNGPSKYNQLLAAQTAAAQAAFLQQALQFHQAAAQKGVASPTSQQPAPSLAATTQPTMRYYDPNSDGFFYEMASVDGWKRRQPNKPVSASVPTGITRPYTQRACAVGAGASPSGEIRPPATGPSYGAALARGQFPRNTVKHELDGSATTTQQQQQPAVAADSASSSQCGDTFAELFNSSDPVYIPRPSALNLEQKAVSPVVSMENQPQNSTAALFEAVLADFGGIKSSLNNVNAILPTMSGYSMNQLQQSPMKETSWNSFRSCSLFSPIKPSKRVLAPIPTPTSTTTTTATAAATMSKQQQQPMGTLIDDMVDDDTMSMLMRDLDKLWANTPVSGLNQA